MSDLQKATVTFSLPQVLVGAVGLAVPVIIGIWAVADAYLGGMEADIEHIRTELADGRAMVREVDGNSGRIELGLRDELAELNAQLRVTNESLRGLSASILRLDERLSVSVSRQQDFEKWVVGRLGPIDARMTTPGLSEEWIGPQDEFFKQLYSSEEPLSPWFRSLDQQQ